MPATEIVDMMKVLRIERAHTRKELKRLDKVISALRDLSSTNSTPLRNGRRRRMSASARAKIGRAQKLRWSKWRQAQKKSA
jgi:hypothetical protein